MKSAVSKYKLIISRVRNWLGLGAIYIAMIFVLFHYRPPCRYRPLRYRPPRKRRGLLDCLLDK